MEIGTGDLLIIAAAQLEIHVAGVHPAHAVLTHAAATADIRLRFRLCTPRVCRKR